MAKLMNLNLQNAEILDKKEMKQVTGGTAMVCVADSDCMGGYCIDGVCEGDEKTYPKIEACEGKKPNDPCKVTLQGKEYNCTCVDFGAGLFCSTLPLFCR